MKILKIIIIFNFFFIFFSCTNSKNVDRNYNQNINKKTKFCFIDNNKFIWISDPIGKEKINTNLKSSDYGGEIYKGSNLPIISQNNLYMAYVDSNSNLNIYNLKTKKNKRIFNNIHGDNYDLLIIVISGWLNNGKLVFNITKAFDPKPTVDIRKIKEGFYTYDENNYKLNYLNEINSVINIIPNTNIILTFKDKKNEIYSLNFDKKDFKKIATLSTYYGQLNTYDINNIVYTDKFLYFFTGIYYHNIEKNKKVLLKIGSFADYQWPQFISSDLILYTRYIHKKGDFHIGELIIHDLISNKKSILNFDCKRCIVKNNWIIILDEKNLYSYNVFTNEKFNISNNVYKIED